MSMSLALCATLLIACYSNSTQQANNVQQVAAEQKEEVEVKSVASKQISNNLIDLVTKAGSSEQDTFNALVAQNALVVVDFYATWCGPCKEFAKILPTVAANNKDILFIKVDTDKHPALSNEYKIRSIPTLVFFKNGKKVLSKAGAPNASGLTDLIKENLR